MKISKAIFVFFLWLLTAGGQAESTERVEARVVGSHKTREGISVKTIRLVNLSDNIINGVVLSLTSQPMSYFGFDVNRLSVFPDGKGSLYFYDSEGGFLLPRQERDVKIFQKGGGALSLKVISGERDIGEQMIKEARLEDIFGSYVVQSKEAFRDTLRNPKAWDALVAKETRGKAPQEQEAVFLQSVSSSIIEEIGGVIGDAIDGSSQRGGVVAHREAVSSFSQAQKAYERGDLEEAEMLLRRSLSFAPGDSLILNNLGYVLFLGKHDHPTAIDYIKKALEAEPENPYYLSSLAEVLWSRGGPGDKTEAVRLIRKANGLDAKNDTGAKDLLEKWEKER